MNAVQICRKVILRQLFYQPSRNYGFRPEWVPKKYMRPNVYKTLEERITEDDYRKNNEDIYKKINIGFPLNKSTSHVARGRSKRGRKSAADNLHLEKVSRERKLMIDLDVVEEEWLTGDGVHHISQLASHYGIFNDLFGPFAYFYPTTALNIVYDYDADTVSPVYFGNTIKPQEAKDIPTINFDTKEDDIWSVVLVSPDNNLLQDNVDSLHWFVGNIKGNDISSGDVVMEYMRPFPPKGTGYHRYVFLLFKQTHKVDFSHMKETGPCVNLEKRNFSMYGFYKENEDTFTPAGISWFQSDWDPSTKEFFHHTLKMKEPIYEYQFPERYLAPQEWFPKRRSFNEYLDLHRDPKELAKEVLIDRLKTLDPFEEEKVPDFPGAIPVDRNKVVWEQEVFKKRNLGMGKYRDMYRGRLRPELLPDDSC